MPTIPLTNAVDLAALQRVSRQRYPLLLASSAQALDASTRQHARHDFLLCGNGEGFVLDADLQLRDLQGQPLPGGFFEQLQRDWTALRVRPDNDDAAAPFRGGWALYLGYELAQEIEPVLQLPQAAGELPIAVALRCPAALLHDHATGQYRLACEGDPQPWLQQVRADLQAAAALPPLPDSLPAGTLHEDDPQRYRDAVQRALTYLQAGDIFQANLSRGWQARFAADVEPAALHRQLLRNNPAPFAGVWQMPAWAVVSASPERLVSIRSDVVQTRPIAGTRPRRPGDDDAARIRELAAHPKERAEHIMLVDLERNDLGRVCRPGTVQVDELMTVESYAHVHHIVSNVSGRLRANAGPVDVLRAVFPGGTITGCPKVRCMQIIAELEGCGRGAYTGAFGWLDRDGDLDMNILIRSAEVQGDSVRFRTGAGIVIDSDPQRELDESRAKARGMLHALGLHDA
ncbi:MAG: aminodeoxychorismate synthase, component I [Pseudoxanthomonas suwonensis]|nr:MAG: aminodeoxychorismate synthase, component I [Pseudoxanthomonas suwonensis]